MIRLQNCSLYRGDRPLFTHANLTIHPGWRVGITGRNGSGKSSLFALLQGELLHDQGDLDLPPQWRIGSVKQETPALDCSALDYVLDGDSALRQLQQQLAQAEAAHDGAAIADLHHQLAAIDGYGAAVRAEKLLAGLGFKAGESSQPVARFSGGWRVRLNLAQALFCPFDLLLLDEPTNHLDLDAILWLQGWLQRCPQTILLISHDRDFLDSIVSHIAHIEQQQLTLTSGHYSDFERHRAEQSRLKELEYTQQQREVAHLKSFIDRFRAKASKAKQAQSRMKQLQKMELLLPAYADSPFHFEFYEPQRMPQPLLSLEQGVIGYGATPTLRHAELQIMPGDHLALLGHNGAGKSTLLRALNGGAERLSGKLQRAADCHIGYFAQHQLEQLDPEATPLQHLQRLDERAEAQTLRNHLGGFGFSGERALSTVGQFSGGEKSRLVLALLVWQRPNLLLLDEPTNHLDLEMRHALTLALQQFSGALVLISHDRHLLRSVTDQFYRIDRGQLVPFEGELNHYEQIIRQEGNHLTTAIRAEEESSNNPSRKEQRQQAAQQRQQQQPLRNALKKVEAALDKQQQQRRALEQQLADPQSYSEGNRARLKELLARKAELDQQIERLEEEWLTLSEALEAG